MTKQLLQQLCNELETARSTAMHNTAAARVPECGDFGAIAQTLDYVVEALRKELEKPQAAPYAWAIQGTSKMWRGEFAELDAKAEAKRCGGTCRSFPLYEMAGKE